MPGAVAPLEVSSGVGQIPFWWRFHVRMSSLFAGVVFVVDLFGSVAAEHKQIVSIYVFRPTNRPNILAFAADYVAPGRSAPAEVGEEYDARQATSIMNGFTAPHVESEFTTDKWGTVLSGYAPIRDADGKAIAIVGIDVDEGD